MRYKFITIGDIGTGKTTYLTRYCSSESDSTEINNIPTIGVEYFIKKKENGDIIQFWDTSGQERFNSITRTFYKNIYGVLLFFDLNNKKSFNNLKYWLNQIKEHVNEKVKIVLIGNKSDLTKNIKNNEIKLFAYQNDIEYFETSVKNNINIYQPIEYLISIININDFNNFDINHISINENENENNLFNCC